MTETLDIVCPHDDAINRVPGARLSEDPKCGKCHKPLFAGEPLELTSARFETHLTRSGIPVVVDFWAPWCGPCRMMAPAYKDAAGLLEPRVRLAKVDTEKEASLGDASTSAGSPRWSSSSAAAKWRASRVPSRSRPPSRHGSERIFPRRGLGRNDVCW